MLRDKPATRAGILAVVAGVSVGFGASEHVLTAPFIGFAVFMACGWGASIIIRAWDRETSGRE